MKLTIVRSIAALALGLGLSGAAHAGAVLFTPPALDAYPSHQTLYCDIFNTYTTSVPQTVTIDIIDYFGNVVATSGPQPLSSGTGTAQGDFSGQGAVCRFTVTGSAKKYRAMGVYDNASAYTVAVPAY